MTQVGRFGDAAAATERFDLFVAATVTKTTGQFFDLAAPRKANRFFDVAVDQKKPDRYGTALVVLVYHS